MSQWEHADILGYEYQLEYDVKSMFDDLKFLLTFTVVFIVVCATTLILSIASVLFLFLLILISIWIIVADSLVQTVCGTNKKILTKSIAK